MISRLLLVPCQNIKIVSFIKEKMSIVRASRNSIASAGEGLQELFMSIRTLFMDHDDKVNFEVFLQILQEAGLPMQNDAEAVFEEIDQNQDGLVSFQQFFGLAMSYMNEDNAAQDDIPFDLNDDIEINQDPLEIILNNNKIRELRELFRAVSYQRYGTKYAKFDDMLKILELSTIKYEVTVNDMHVFFQNEMILMTEISEEEYSRVIKDLEAAWLKAYGVGLYERDEPVSNLNQEVQYSSPSTKVSASSFHSSPYAKASPVVDTHSVPLDALYDLLKPFLEQAQWRDSSDSYVNDVIKQALDYVEKGKAQVAGSTEDKEQIMGKLVEMEEEMEEMSRKFNEAETSAINYENLCETLSQQKRRLQQQQKSKTFELQNLRSQNQELGKRALLMDRLQNENRTLQRQYEELQQDYMRNEQQCRVMGEIAIKYGGETLRKSNVYEKVRRTTMVKDHQSAPAEISLDQIIEEDAKDEAAYLSEKVEKLSAEIKNLMEENLKLRGQIKSFEEKKGDIGEEKKEEVTVKQEEVVQEAAKEEVIKEEVQQQEPEKEKQVQEEAQAQQEAGEGDKGEEDKGEEESEKKEEEKEEMETKVTASFASIIRNESMNDRDSDLLQMKKTEEAQEESKLKDEELDRKNEEIKKLHNLLKQMANKKSRAPTMIRGPSIKPTPSVLGGGGRFSTVNFRVPKNFDFLGYTQKVKIDEDIEETIPSKSCPKYVAEFLQDTKSDRPLGGNNPLFYSSQAQILQSNLKKEENVVMIATENHVYFFDKHKHKLEAGQIITDKTDLIVISSLSEALVIRAHSAERTQDPLHMLIQTPYRTELIMFLHEVMRRKFKKQLHVNFQNKLKVRKMNKGGREVETKVIDFEQQNKLEKINFANALQKGVLTIYNRKKILKSKKWKDHFCVLTNVGLLEFKSLNVSDGILALQPTIDSKVEIAKNPPKGGQHCFEIDNGTSSEPLVFSAKSEEDRADWMNGMKKLQRDFDQKRDFLLKKIAT